MRRGLLPDFMELDEAPSTSVDGRCPSRCPSTRLGRPRFGHAEREPELLTVAYGGGDIVAIPAADMDAVLLHMNRAGEGAVSSSAPTSTSTICSRWLA